MYIVIELQTNEAGQMAYLANVYSDRPHANQKYHTILAAAAVSGLPMHTAIILDASGQIMNRECYINGSRKEEIVE